jgi:hypothetical protein
MYATDYLDVWPLNPIEARAAVADCGMQPETKVKYLNYHSRFSHAFSVAHPQVARLVVALEEVLTRMPILPVFGDYFSLYRAKTAGHGDTVFGAQVE